MNMKCSPHEIPHPMYLQPMIFALKPDIYYVFAYSYMRKINSFVSDLAVDKEEYKITRNIKLIYIESSKFSTIFNYFKGKRKKERERERRINLIDVTKRGLDRAE